MSLEKAENHLRGFGLEKRIITFQESSATVELAAKAAGVDADQIAKSLSFLVDGQAVIVVASGMARIDNHKFKETFHTKAKMIPGPDVERLTGFAPGGVCPFGLNEGVRVYLDASLKKHETVYPAAGTDNSAVRLSISELEKCACPVGWVDVCKEETKEE